MSGGWSHLEVSSLTCLVLVWVNFRLGSAGAVNWRTKMWPLHVIWAFPRLKPGFQEGKTWEGASHITQGSVLRVSITRDPGRSCQPSSDPDLEVTTHHFHCILLWQANHYGQFISAEGELNSISWWRSAKGTLQKNMCYGRYCCGCLWKI